MEQLLSRYNPWWESKNYLSGIIERPKLLAKLAKRADSSQAVFVTGLRRVGKTTLMKLFIRSLIEDKEVPPSRLLYISLDDYLLEKHAVVDLVEKFRSMHRLPFSEHVYLFFDEVAHRKDIELQLKNIYDSHNATVIASSSSASVLRSKKPYLTGRSVLLEVKPLCFDEYLAFRNIAINKSDSHLRDSHFDEYLKTGGIPRYVIDRDPEYLQTLVDDILTKDIVALHSIRNPHTIRDLFLLLMERSGKLVSVNKVANILGISPDTARRYVDLLSETYLIHPVARFGHTNEHILSPKKIYAADLGIRAFFTGPQDLGSLFENEVFFRLMNQKPRYVRDNGTEIDFLTRDGLLVEAKYGDMELSEKQQKLFDSIKAKEKIIVRNETDLGKLSESR